MFICQYREKIIQAQALFSTFFLFAFLFWRFNGNCFILDNLFIPNPKILQNRAWHNFFLFFGGEELFENSLCIVLTKINKFQEIFLLLFLFAEFYFLTGLILCLHNIHLYNLFTIFCIQNPYFSSHLSDLSFGISVNVRQPLLLEDWTLHVNLFLIVSPLFAFSTVFGRETVKNWYDFWIFYGFDLKNQIWF